MVFIKRTLTCALLLVLSAGLVADRAGAVDKEKKVKDRREGKDQYNKWLNEDVVYIITDEEKAVFKKLTTHEEREKFIEAFWLRRDPSPGTSENEFKEEHYRRIAYANERFASGLPGWKTDRGRIYIMFGKPDEIESHPSGGAYNRPYYEGGGSTSTFPFEIWRYRYLEGVGQDIEIEFVDKSMSGEYRIALSPDEKDALLFVPNAGLTEAEMMGLSDKSKRPYFNPSANPETQLYSMRMKDMPFERLAQYVNLQRPPAIKFKDMQAAVRTHISYQQLPLQMRIDYIRLHAENILVPITLEIDNSNLQFKSELGIYRGVINVYGSVTALNQRVEREFEDVITTDYSEGDLERGKQQKSLYQKLVSLRPGRYKLNLVAKDVNSGNMATFEEGIHIPKPSETELGTSTLILASKIQPIKNLLAAQKEQFVIGDVKVMPNVQRQFKKGDNLNLYLQVYNTAIDQAKLVPSVKVEYEILKGQDVVRKIEDTEGKSVEFFSGQRIVLVRSIPLSETPAGDYKIKVHVTDNITNKKVTAESNFKII
jgi:GWxTD domain-containing protein